jgi:CheY-like chemotaxis protein
MAKSAPVPAQSLRILLAEDNPINQKVALGQLQRLGYQATVVGNGLAVLQALEDSAFDVILMDCQMPELDGYETTGRIRQRERQSPGQHVHIIAMTAHAMKGDREKCLAAGMDDYVTKPIRTGELGKALEHCAAQVRAAAAAAVVQAQAQAQAQAAPAPGSALAALVAQASPTVEAAPEPPPVELEWLMEAVGGIEEEARALAEFYLEQSSEMLQRLEAGVGGFVLKEIEQVAHKLAGASASCGITILVGPLRELEHSARDGALDPDKASKLLGDITRRHARVREFLATWCPQKAGVGAPESTLK